MTSPNALFKTRRLTGQGPVRNRPSPMALERRVMFDGAGAGDLAAAADKLPTDASAQREAHNARPTAESALTTPAASAPLLRIPTSALDASPALARASAQAQGLLDDFLQRPDAREQLFALFNGGQIEANAAWQQAADTLLAELRSGSYSIQVQLLTGEEMQSALGAFAAQGPGGSAVIFVNADWLKQGPGSASISRVLLEELGHSLDARLNPNADTAGDEGEAFAALASGIALTKAESDRIATENDHAVVVINGKAYAVEDAAPAVGTATQSITNDYSLVNSTTNGFSVTASTNGAAATIFVRSIGSPTGFGVGGGNNEEIEPGESITITLDNPLSTSNVVISWMNSSEQATYALYLDSTLVKTANLSGGTDGFDTYTLSASGSRFNKIVFTASNPGDDYLINQISYLVLSTVTVAEDTSFSFTGANSLSVTDSDNNVTSTALSVTNGTLNVTLSGGASLSAGANSSANLTISGSQTAINATLATLTYQGTLNFNGSDTMTVVATDATAATDTIRVPITVTPVNDTPVSQANTFTALARSSASDALMTGKNIITNTDSTAGTDSDQETATSALQISKINGVTFAANGTDASHLAANGWMQVDLLTNSVIQGTLFVKNDGTTEFSPTVGLNTTADATQTFTYAITDGTLISDNATVQLNIKFDPRPTVSVSSVTVSEASAYAVFQVSMDLASATATTFTPTLSSGTGTVGTDTGATLQYLNGSTWTNVTGAVTIAAGSTSVLLRTTIVNDTTYEGSETFTLSTGDISGTITGTSLSNTGAATGTGTIKDDGSSTNVFLVGNTTSTPTVGSSNNDTPTVSVSSVTVSEASPYAVFEVSLSNASASAVSFTPSLTDGTATVGTDTGASAALQYYNGTNWVSAAGGVTIAAGSTSVLVRTAITNDTTYEASEAFTLSTGTITGTVTNTGAATGTGTIKDDGSSTNVFLVGNTTSTPTVGSSNNDTPTVSVSSVTVSEASPYAVFQVSLSNASASAVSFTPTLASGTATAGTDFGATLQYLNGSTWTNVTGPLSIAAGSTSVLLRTAIVNNDLYEGPESFTLSTGTITGTVTSTAALTATGTIEDDGSSTNVFEIGNNTATPTVGTADNDKPTISVSSVTVSEASPYAVFQVSLNKASGSAISFTPTLIDGTATVGTDTGASAALEYYNGTNWVSAAGGVTIAAGSTSVLLRTTIVNDDLYEGSDTFTLSTGTITGTVTNSGAASGTGTIKDDGSSTNVFESGNNTATPTVGSPNDDSPKPPPPKPDPLPIPPPPVAQVTTLQAQTTTTNLPIWVPEVIKPSATTRTVEVPTLVMAERIPDQFAERNSVAVISVPDRTFMVSTPGQQLTLTAEQANGTPLPSWLSFNSNTRRFEGQPPPNFVGELNLKVTARDGQGGEAEAQFRLQIGSPDNAVPDAIQVPNSPNLPISSVAPGNLTGRTSLQQQLREMAQLRRGDLTRINTARNSGPAPATRG